MDEEDPLAVAIEVGNRDAPGSKWLVTGRRCTILLEATAELACFGAFEVSPEGESASQGRGGDVHDGYTE